MLPLVLSLWITSPWSSLSLLTDVFHLCCKIMQTCGHFLIFQNPSCNSRSPVYTWLHALKILWTETLTTPASWLLVKLSRGDRVAGFNNNNNNTAHPIRMSDNKEIEIPPTTALILKRNSFFICNSNLAGCPVLYLEILHGSYWGDWRIGRKKGGTLCPIAHSCRAPVEPFLGSSTWDYSSCQAALLPGLERPLFLWQFPALPHQAQR